MATPEARLLTQAMKLVNGRLSPGKGCRLFEGDLSPVAQAHEQLHGPVPLGVQLKGDYSAFPSRLSSKEKAYLRKRCLELAEVFPPHCRHVLTDIRDAITGNIRDHGYIAEVTVEGHVRSSPGL